MKTTITISRQMGSGASYIGQVIATRFGLKYVDREVLRLAAEEFGCDEETVAARAERVSSFWERAFSGLTFGTPDSRYTPPPLQPFSDEQLFEKQTEILKRIAAKHDCVVIGWAGVHLLPRHRGTFSLFCHAPMKFRVQRISELYGDTPQRARTMLDESDEMRERYFKAMTGCDWTCAVDYDLAIDTSLLPLDDIAEIIIDILRRRKIVD